MQLLAQIGYAVNFVFSVALVVAVVLIARAALYFGNICKGIGSIALYRVQGEK